MFTPVLLKKCTVTIEKYKQIREANILSSKTHVSHSKHIYCLSHWSGTCLLRCGSVIYFSAHLISLAGSMSSLMWQHYHNKPSLRLHPNKPEKQVKIDKKKIHHPISLSLISQTRTRKTEHQYSWTAPSHIPTIFV